MVFVVCILVFQNLPLTFIKSTNQSALLNIRYLDEVTFLGSLVILFSLILLNPVAYKIRKLPFTKYIFFFFFIALISIWYNKVQLDQGLFGTYDVIKNILVLYVFSHLRFRQSDISKMIDILKNISIVIGIVAIIAEIVAIIWGVGIGYFVIEEKRLGFHRVVSLAGTGNWNYLGIYMTLIFYLSISSTKPSWKMRGIWLTSLSTIFLTFSRQAWIGFGLMACIFKKRLIPLGALIVVMGFWMFLMNLQEFNPKYYYRGFAFLESLKILTDNPILGVGPGMFGGLAASLFGTPYYESWPPAFRDIEIGTRNIDLFWPWVWGEFGLLGFMSYISIWISIYFYMEKIGEFFSSKGNKYMWNLAKILRYFMLVLVIMGFGGGLNAAFVTFTYFALVGMLISTYRLERLDSLG